MACTRNWFPVGIILPAAILLLTQSVQISVQAPNEDRIDKLPGLNSTITFRQYSGYLQAAKDKFLHYWYAESQHSPNTDPLLLWLNGGPGCSSLDGFLYELGPLHVHNDGKTVYSNKNAWNIVSNLLFIESPPGVGFSYTTGPIQNYTFDDDIVANDNYQAIKNFFKKFPELRSHDFYIAGESYGGVYIPTLALLLSKDPSIKLKGFAVGNGMSSYYLNAQSLPYFAFYHALIDQTLFDKLLKFCCEGPRDVNCNFYNNTDIKCGKGMGEVRSIMYGIGLNMYGLYTDCWKSREKYVHLMTLLLGKSGASTILQRHETSQVKGGVHGEDTQVKGGVHGTPPCINVTAVSKWLNTDGVRSALHIPDHVQRWQVCSEVVGSHYKTLYRDMAPFYHQLLPAAANPRGVRAMVYNGDTDMACNVLMDEWFVEGLKRRVETPWHPWHLNGQVAGFSKTFSNLTFVTIKGAGHMVPQWKPAPALKMISSFIFNKPLD